MKISDDGGHIGHIATIKERVDADALAADRPMLASGTSQCQ